VTRLRGHLTLMADTYDGVNSLIAEVPEGTSSTKGSVEAVQLPQLLIRQLLWQRRVTQCRTLSLTRGQYPTKKLNQGCFLMAIAYLLWQQEKRKCNNALSAPTILTERNPPHTAWRFAGERGFVTS
jgi:hypothetical protein